MFENRNLASDLFALGLLVVTVFVGISLLTYDPADPVGEPMTPLNRIYAPDIVAYPQNENVANACGRWGAHAAELLFTAFGVCAYYLLISLAVLDYHLLRRREIDTPVVRAIGWAASIVGIAAIVAILAPGFSPGPVIGSAGYLGALTKALLHTHFATPGSLILAASLFGGGLLLCTDYVLLRMFVMIVSVALIGPVRAAKLLPARRPAKATKKKAADDAENEVLDENDEVVSVKFRSRPTGDIAEDELSGLDEAIAAAQDDDATKRKAKRLPTLKIPSEVLADPADEVEETGGDLRIRKPTDRNAREAVMQCLNEASRGREHLDYVLPSLDLLMPSEDFCFDEQEKEVRRKAKVLEKTFADFGLKVKVVEIETGPVVAQYEVELEAGLRLSKVTALADDLAIALRVPSVRIVAPIPGKNTVGIEVPNEQRQTVRLREVIEEGGAKVRKMRVPLFLGKDVSGSPLLVDLSSLPHLLIAGRTGTGKSVCLNAIITSILMTRRPDEVRMLMIDPKMVELSGYGRLPHLMHPVVTDMKKAEAILAWAVDKMEERYALLARAGVRHISSYNQLDEEELMSRLNPESEEERASIPLHLPFIVIVADEIADMMMTAGKEVEQHIIRLAQKSRAVGIHLILATQKPTVDVITGLIKSNLPARISFQVASRTDSRVVLDEMGAEKLLGNGDMLFLWPGTSTLLRGQGTYLDDEEIARVVDFVSTTEPDFVHELVNLQVEDKAEGPPSELKKRDELYETAVDMVVREGRGSVSLLQRAMGIGYGRAARLIDFMAEDGIVGPYAGSQAREILITLQDWERMRGAGGDEPVLATPAAAKKSRKVSLRPPVKPVPELDMELDFESDHDEFEDEDDDFEDEVAEKRGALARYSAS
jgi:DNA segregation ATPase FtsK/SpoIIIE, S-DNA-T family